MPLSEIRDVATVQGLRDAGDTVRMDMMLVRISSDLFLGWIRGMKGQVLVVLEFRGNVSMIYCDANAEEMNFGLGLEI